MKSAVLARASGAARVIGFSIWHLREKTARPFYSDAHDAEGGHVIREEPPPAARASASRTTTIRFPLADVRVAGARRRCGARIPPDRRFALINPGAAWPNKRWPPERFGELAAFLRDACGLTPVVLWGPGEEALADAVVAASADAAVAAPPTRVADLVALARAAALVVSGDTGPLHIATAVGTPTVSLFGPTDPERNGPYRGGRRRGVALRRLRLPLRSPLPRAAVVPRRGDGRRSVRRACSAASRLRVV